ncbi:predicted protein [Histoplasma capsulatum G186AR]|uniref:Uncharacterized protein n=1 Tax=Ajellomyces capsulatus (strain G186AR / H82 / ATCC MYA-2454 / RMSCC 2432) TaxID=447093 RepID=C0NQ47_AJECG|nr:uncharacterized protein HCBG_05277 [Histoplasma capsulatum G186AR]EEH07056.1 predicted protein [Histoplasma capsulatum G186AR]
MPALVYLDNLSQKKQDVIERDGISPRGGVGRAMDFGKWEQAGQGWGKVGRGTGILKKRGHSFAVCFRSRYAMKRPSILRANGPGKLTSAYNEIYKKSIWVLESVVVQESPQRQVNQGIRCLERRFAHALG